MFMPFPWVFVQIGTYSAARVQVHYNVVVQHISYYTMETPLTKNLFILIISWLTIVEDDLKAPFSIATIHLDMSRGGLLLSLDYFTYS